MDCHSDNPQVNNFGNIFSGRNAVSLIERAISLNTGGMGYFGNFYSPADLADIAAYLGNQPQALDFGRQSVGNTSGLRTVTVSSSTKQGLDALSLRTEGDFSIQGGSCGTSLPRSSTCSVELAFRPSVAGARFGALHISHNGTPTPVRIALAGEGLAAPKAVANLRPLKLDFAGPGRVRNLMVANDSPAPLTLLGLALKPADYAVVGGSCLLGVPVAPRQRCSLSLRFTPLQAGTRAGRLTLTHDGVAGASEVELIGRSELSGTPVVIDAEPAWLSFGVVERSGLSSKPQTLTLHNRGAAAWSATSVLLSDPQFVIRHDACAGSVVPPGGHCQVVVGFEPQRAGPGQGELTVSMQPDLRVALVARTLAAGGDWLEAIPARPHFEAALGDTPAMQRLTLANRGASPVPLRSLSLSGTHATDFALLAEGDCAVGATLAAGASCGVGLRFAPAASGQRSALLRVETGSPGQMALQVELRGLARTSTTSRLMLDANALQFAPRLPGQEPQALSLSLSNRGSVTLSWRSLAISGEHAPDFAMTTECSQGLKPGANCRLHVRFVPRAASILGEVRLASLVLHAEDATEPALVQLRGSVGAAQVLLADQAVLDFGRQALSVEVQTVQRLSLSNLAAVPVTPLMRVEGPFQIVTAPCASGLKPGESCPLQLRFVPTAPGAARGRLLIRAVGGAAEQAVALWAEAVEAAPLLVLQSAPSLPSHPETVVGAVAVGESLQIWNRGNAATQPLRLQLTGPAATEFSMDAAASTCQSGLSLAPGASCRLRMLFHPGAAGQREAWLQIGAAPGTPLLGLRLQARAQAGVGPSLQLLPTALDFVAAGAAPPPAQALWLRNEGTAALALDAFSLQNSGFALAALDTLPCAQTDMLLLPGDTCALTLSWLGRADAAAGGALLVGGEASLGDFSVPLSVSESAELRSNQGGGGGATGPGLLVLLLAAVLAVSRARASSDPRHQDADRR
jgi:hypothetical protein